MTSSLSKADVARLMSDPTPDARVDTATKVATEFQQQKLSDKEREIAKEIFRVLVKDAEVRVREALSAQLKSSPDLPHDVAVTLAKDVESVALPMLRYSEVLTDDDLIEVVRVSGPEQQVAVAQRDRVSSQLAGALIDTRNEMAVARLVANEGADLDEGASAQGAQRIRGERRSLRHPDAAAQSARGLSEQLVSAVSRKLEAFLVDKHELPPDAAASLILQVRERATVSLLSDGSSDDELEQLVEQLHVNGRLTPSLVMRALCMGDMAFFETAMARLAGIAVQNARILIHDKGTLGLESIFLRAGMPETLFAAVQAGVEVANETDYDGGENDRQRYVERMLERILTQWEDPSERLGEDDIEYLMKKLLQLAA